MPRRRKEDSDTRSADAQIGPILKSLRTRAGMSLRTLAARVGFSASFLSQLEKGQVSPSIASLGRIAGELGVTLAELFHSAHAPAQAVVRGASRPAFTSEWSRARIESLTSPATGGVLEALAVTIAPSGTSGRHLTTHVQPQFAYQLRGTLTLFIGEERMALKPGDTVGIRAGTPHRWQNDSRRDAQVLLVFGRVSP
jgi:transcriptional regulator with XRE-family HTH domain